MSRRDIRIVVLLAAVVCAVTPGASAAAEGDTQVMALLANAHTCSRHGDLNGALAAAGQAAALAPDYPEVHATLALLHHCRADTDQAYEHYTQFQLLSLRAGDGYDGDLTRRLAEGEALMVLLVNSERRTRGLPLLSPDLRLTEMARRHSDEMRDLGYFSHESPLRRNRDLGERFQRAFGHAAQALAENLSRMRGTLWCFTPEHLRDSHNRLMASTGHRGNILWGRPTHIGVGIAVSPRGDYWVTENFALIDR